jgi:hypothetical protein
VQALTDLGQTIAQESGSTQARDITNRHQRIRKRWRYVFTETSAQRDLTDTTQKAAEQQEALPTNRRSSTSPCAVVSNERITADQKNVNVIDAWADEALHTLGKNCNVSELKELRLAIKQLQGLQAGLAAKKAALEELLSQFGITSPGCQQARLKLERIGQLLPKRLSYLIEKSDRLLQLVEAIEANQQWAKDVQDRHNLANNNNDDQAALRLAVSEKEYELNKLMSGFQLLEREVASSGLAVNPTIVGEMAELRAQWFQLTAESRRVTSVASSMPPLLLTANMIITNAGGDMPKTSSSHSVSSFVSAASLTTTPTSQSSEQWAASPTTASASPMEEEVVMPVLMMTAPEKTELQQQQQQLLWSRVRRISDWLSGLAKPTSRIDVADTQSVGVELDRLRAMLAQLEAKRQQKDDIMKQLDEIRTQESGSELKLYCDELSSRWHSIQQELMARKTELTAMLEHSDNVTTKGKEVSQWLSKLESTYEGAPVGKTRDVLLRQIREVNQVHRELQQYGHHVALLSQVIRGLNNCPKTIFPLLQTLYFFPTSQRRAEVIFRI